MRLPDYFSELLEDLAKARCLKVELSKSEAFEVLEVIQGHGADGSVLIDVEQRLIDFVYGVAP